MGVNVISNEQVHARRAGCECPRMTFGRRIEVAGISGRLSEASVRAVDLLKNLDSGLRRNDEMVCL